MDGVYLKISSPKKLIVNSKKSHSSEVWQICLDSGYDILNNGSVSKNNYEQAHFYHLG
jgi:hypothetical protein